MSRPAGRPRRANGRDNDAPASRGRCLSRRMRKVRDDQRSTLPRVLSNIWIATDSISRCPSIDYPLSNGRPTKSADKRAIAECCQNFFSQLKRSISGTHHNISPEHLHRYLSEFAYRHSTHAISDTERMVRLMGQVHGKRVTYRPLTIQ